MQKRPGRRDYAKSQILMEDDSVRPEKACKNHTWDDAKRLSVKVALIALICFVILHYFLGIRVLYGNSGYPSVRDGDLVIYRIYGKENINRGDVVLYKKDDRVVPARVIGLPGESIDITEQGILVNGVIMPEEIMYPTSKSEDGVVFPVSVGTDTLFLLNDYRSDQTDGRENGPTPTDDVVGVIVLLIRWRGF
ncbi:MAG: signal peptidase I [Lachnospiraceae bacterium]|nr:signal peptidase I [Lachnospiraceae bacterium]